MACASGPHVQRSQVPALPLAEHLDVEVRLTQHQIKVSYVESQAGAAAGLQMAATSPTVAAGGFAGGAAAGLIGALIDSAVTAHRSSVAQEMEKPIQAHTRELSIDDLVQQSFDGLDRKRFAEQIAFERLDKTEDEDSKHLKPGSNILVLSPHYSVSYEGTFFSYVLEAKLVDRTQDAKGRIKTTVRYRQMVEYVLPQDQVPGGVRWGDLSAEQWKAILESATAETIAMLNHDIGASPSDTQPKKLYEKQIVLLDEDKGARSWVRTNFSLLSVPSARLKDKT